MTATSQVITVQASEKFSSLGYFPLSMSASAPPTPPCSPPKSASIETIPISPAKRSVSRHHSRESFASNLSGGVRTLIVDDNPVNLSILERTLKLHFSHLVSSDIALANSGNAALSQLSSTVCTPRDEIPPPIPPLKQETPPAPFDLILLDINMPNISGVQVAERIRNVHGDHATAIVAVTTAINDERTNKSVWTALSPNRSISMCSIESSPAHSFHDSRGDDLEHHLYHQFPKSWPSRPYDKSRIHYHATQ